MGQFRCPKRQSAAGEHPCTHWRDRFAHDLRRSTKDESYTALFLPGRFVKSLSIPMPLQAFSNVTRSSDDIEHMFG